MRLATTDEYFGGCPECGKADISLNAGSSHWHGCSEHKLCWYVGANLFSHWRSQSVEEQRRLWEAADFDSFKEVEPVYPEA